MSRRLHTLPHLLGVLVLCVLPLSVDARPRGIDPDFDETPIVLQTFQTAHIHMDLALVPCQTHACPIQVRLYEDGHITDRYTLPVTARMLRPKAETVDENWGADPGLKAWRSGFESDYVATAARLITVAPGLTGLLVTQRHNFEPMKHEHLLITGRKGKLRVLWRSQEEGAIWSSTHVIRGYKGSQDIAHFEASPEADGVADHYEATRLRWDTATSKFQASPLPDSALPLFVLSLGKYDTTAKAREARTLFSFCLTSYWVLDATPFPGKAHAMVGKIYTRKASAEAAEKQLKTCLPDLKPAILSWEGGPAPVPPAPAPKTAPKALPAASKASPATPKTRPSHPKAAETNFEKL